MVASNKTVVDIIGIIMKHVDVETAQKIVDDLKQVEGSASFRETIMRMEREIADRVALYQVLR